MNFSFLCDDSLFPGEHVPGCFGKDDIETNLDLVLQALKTTATLSVSALCVAVIIGIIIGSLKTLQKSPFLKGFATIWVEIFRNIPLIIQLFLFYYVVPKIFPQLTKYLSPYMLVVLGLGFFTSARIAEQIRAAIEATPFGQRYAAMALGFKTNQIYRYVLLPRAIRTIMPPLISESMGVIKNSAVAFAVSVPELLNYTREATDKTSLPIENYFLTTILYMGLALIVFTVMSLIEHSIKIPGLNNGGKN